MHQAACWAELYHDVMMSPKSRHASIASQTALAGAKDRRQETVPRYLCTKSYARIQRQGRKAEAITFDSMTAVANHQAISSFRFSVQFKFSHAQLLFFQRDFYVGRVRKYGGK